MLTPQDDLLSLRTLLVSFFILSTFIWAGATCYYSSLISNDEESLSSILFNSSTYLRSFGERSSRCLSLHLLLFCLGVSSIVTDSLHDSGTGFKWCSFSNRSRSKLTFKEDYLHEMQLLPDIMWVRLLFISLTLLLISLPRSVGVSTTSFAIEVY